MASAGMSAGKLRDRITFQAHITVPDGAGGGDVTWVDQFTVAGRVMTGSVRERLAAGRLEASNEAIVRIRFSKQVLVIKPDWRIIVNRDATRPYQIRSIPEDPHRKRQWLDFAVEHGVAT